MRLPPGWDSGDDDEVILKVAELEKLKAYIARLYAERDHARAWAAVHQSDAVWERERLGLLLKVRGIPDSLVPKPQNREEPKVPVDLATVSADGWNGLTPGLQPTQYPTTPKAAK